MRKVLTSFFFVLRLGEYLNERARHLPHTADRYCYGIVGELFADLTELQLFFVKSSYFDQTLNKIGSTFKHFRGYFK